MTTISFNVTNGVDARLIAKVLGKFESVRDFEMYNNKPAERLSWDTRTHEERVASVRRGMEDYRAGRVFTSDELRAIHPRV